MPHAAIVLINGFPGVGKHACARELSKLVPNSRVLDTHQLDLAANTLHPSSAQSDDLRYKLRETVLASIFDTPSSDNDPTATSPPVYILTDTLYSSLPTSRYQDLYLKQANDHHLPLIHLTLTCSTDANVARVTDPTRLSLKDHDETHVIENIMTYEIAHFVKPGRVGKGNTRGVDAVEGLVGEFEVDTTSLDARQTAAIFAEYVQDALRQAGWYFHLNRVKRVR